MAEPKAQETQQKLEKLTPEQEALIPVVRDEWLNRFFKPETPDLPKIRQAVKWLYALAELPEPLTVIVDSPFAAQLVANLIPAFNDNKVEELIRGVSKDAIASLLLQGGAYKNDMLVHVSSDVPEGVKGEPFKLLTELPAFQVAWNVVSQAIDQKIHNLYAVGIGTPLDPKAFCMPDAYAHPELAAIFNEAVEAVCKVDLKYLDFAYHFNCMDYHWVAFYDFFTRIGVVKHEPFNEYLDFLKAGVYESIQLRGMCVVSLMPKAISRDDQNSLHCPEGPSIEWKDGYKLYYINGVYFQPSLYNRLMSDQITAQEVLKIDNAEQKGVALKIFGYDRLLKETHSKVIDKHLVDIKGKEASYDLIEANLGDDGDNPARFVKVVCWSVGKETMLRVPYADPQCQTALGAVAWTAQMTTDEYKLDIET